ncbi:MAG: hypothetical protein VX259_00145, partial [Pseudomonadota bacterium]|nr:hypothetical protein [Pseudomonadota bacterium]
MTTTRRALLRASRPGTCSTLCILSSTCSRYRTAPAADSPAALLNVFDLDVVIIVVQIIIVVVI